MHILLIHQAFTALDEAGGTRHHELANYLAQNGHRVTVIASSVSYLTGKTSQAHDNPVGSRQAPGQEKFYKIPQGYVTIHRAYTYSALHRSFIHRVVSFFSFMISSFVVGLRVRDVDLVWGTSPPIFQGVTAWLLARLKRVPFLFEVRDLWPAFAIQVGVLRHRWLICASEWLERFLYHHADQVLVNSPGFSTYVLERGACKVALVPNGADPRMFDPLTEASTGGAIFRQAFGFQDKTIMLYAGAHGMSNDLEIVLQAAAILRDRPDIAVVLVGDGKEKPALEASAESMGLTNVYFLPPIPKWFAVPVSAVRMPLAEDEPEETVESLQQRISMTQALAAADACIAILKPVPLYATVYPNKVFDYMAAGRAVVLVIDGVIRELVEGASAGIFVPPGDAQSLAEAMRLLADNVELRQKMGMNGRRLVEEDFDREKLAYDLQAILEALVHTG